MFFFFFSFSWHTRDREHRGEMTCKGGFWKDIAEVRTWLSGGSSVFFFFFPPHSKMLLGNQGRPNWQNLWEMGRKTKIKGSRVWRFISSPTIKEVCTTPMLYLTKTEREKRRKIILALIGATVFFPTSLFFLKWRLGKNVYQEEWQKHKKRTPPIDREAKRVRIHNGENKRTRDRGRRKKRAW